MNLNLDDILVPFANQIADDDHIAGMDDYDSNEVSEILTTVVLRCLNAIYPQHSVPQDAIEVNRYNIKGAILDAATVMELSPPFDAGDMNTSDGLGSDPDPTSVETEDGFEGR